MATDASGLVGKRIREYEVLELIGRGGMGAVYRAKHVLLQEDRAIKVVSRSADDHEFIERFIREARVLARLKDDHLVRLYEFWEDGGQLFMALEFLRGESVAHRLQKRTRLALEEAIGIARQAALGLKVAHEGKVVHRDISPDNLQLVGHPGEDEIVKVMDFGIAKAIEEVQRELTANLFLGKFQYASPEQCGFGLEKGETIDWRSDIYSLGVTLFKMTTGLLPFSAGTPQGFMLKHATEHPPAPSTVAPEAHLPAELDQLVLRALAKKRTSRQQSMAELIAELDRVPLVERTEAAASTLVVTTPSPGGAVSPSPIPGHRASGRTGGLKIGESFARKYVIKGLLGEGGMGVVYRAMDTILNEPVALKVISARILEGKDSVERLKREVVLARRVAHPNVCRIYDIGESEAGTHYVSMEFIDGKPLGRVLKERDGALGPGESVPLVRQILDALAAAHGANVIHRDLKPDNIMVTAHGHAVIMDFGLSLSEDSERVTQAGFLVGTPHYMAPEQVTGLAVDTRCDLYAVGVILFRMVTGRLPFTSASTLDILRAHLESPPPRPSELNPAVTPLLESIILKALEKTPANRFATAEDFLAALDAVEPARVRTSTEAARTFRGPRTGRRPGDDLPTRVLSPSARAASPASLPTDREHVRGFLAGSSPPASAAEPTVQAPDGLSRTRALDRTPAVAPTLPGLAPKRSRVEPPPPARFAWPTIGGAAAVLIALAGAAFFALHEPTAPSAPPSTERASPSSPPQATPPAPESRPSPMAAPPSTLAVPAASPSPARPLPTRSTSPPPIIATPSTTLPPQTPPTTVPAVGVPVTVPTTVPAAPQTPAPPIPPPTLPPEQGVRQALREYAEAFSRLDKASVRRIYPTVPDRNFEELERNFKAYEMEIEVVKLEIQLPRVIVDCRIRHTYTSFAGKKDSRTVKERMVFIESKSPPWVRVQ